MTWDTLPVWFWAVFYLFMLATLGTAIFNLIKKRMLNLSMLTIVITIAVPIIGLANTIGRPRAMNEFQYFTNQFLQGEVWSYLLVIGLLFLVGWWVSFIVQMTGTAKE